MRIAYLCADPGVPVYGSKGASIHVREMTRALQREGHEVLLLATRAGGVRPEGYTVALRELAPEPMADAIAALVRHDPEGGAGTASALRSVFHALTLRLAGERILRRFGPDLIYERAALLAPAGIELAGMLGVPHILELNAPLVDEHARHRQLALVHTARAVEQRILAGTDRLLTVSPALAEWAIAAGAPPDRVSVLPNGVDPELFDVPAQEGRALRRGLGLGSAPIVGFVGTLKPWHDVAGLLRAAAALVRQGRRLGLLIVGDGPQRPELARLAGELGLADRTVFTGTVEHGRVAEHLAAMDVAVVPYATADEHYFSPLKLYEYMAAGLPVVAAEAGSADHCLAGGRCGETYRPGDDLELARAIGRMLDVGSSGRAALGAAGRRHVIAHHTWRATARRVVELADQLGAGRPTHRAAS